MMGSKTPFSGKRQALVPKYSNSGYMAPTVIVFLCFGDATKHLEYGSKRAVKGFLTSSEPHTKSIPSPSLDRSLTIILLYYLLVIKETKL